MEIESSDIGEAATRIALKGRLDTPGVGQVETRFAASLVPKGRSALVDLSGVTFLSSMGIRMLIATAQALTRKHARIVLFGAQPLVRETLENASIDKLVPIVADEGQARELLGVA